jgi:phosphatidylserine/phosphatidylglycerophosphate/cardiolipin synthase-like enzyme
MSKQILGTLILILGLLAACTTPAPVSTLPPTLSPTFTPAITPTSIPLPDADQLWQRAQTCNCLQVYTQPETGDSIILKAIDSAKKSVRLKMYLFTRDNVRDALINAAKRGVHVRILMELNPYGGTTTNVDLFNAVKGTPVQMRWASFDFRFTHEKSLVIDDQIAFIMTHNITASSFNANREYGVIDARADDVAEIIRVFEADWEKQPIDLKNPRLVWSPINARQKLIELMDSAKVSLDLEQNEWYAQEIVEHVVAAQKRGVKVRGIFSPRDPITADDAEPNRELIRQNGGQVKYMRSPYIHAKMFLVDGQRAFVGSVNVSDNSLNNNRELGIIFDQADAVAIVRQTFEKDWNLATIEPFPVSDFQIPPSGIVNWKDAAKVYNREVTIEGKIVKIYNSGRVMWLQFSEDWQTDMKVVIFPSDWGKWPQRPDLMYMGKTIHVTGKVVEYQGAPEIVVNDPKFITIVE